jgi:hypothetical protein
VIQNITKIITESFSLRESLILQKAAAWRQITKTPKNETT